MKQEVLISTMYNKIRDYSLFSKMNIQTDATIYSQGERAGFEEVKEKYHYRIFYDTQFGIGRSRNNLLLKARNEISILADDDMIFKDNYSEIVKSVFKRIPSADVIIFNIDDGGERAYTKKDTKINKFTFTRYGAARIAFKTDSILNKKIFFDMQFGGGTKYGSGEDTLFLNECLKKKLNVFAVNETIATLSDTRPSTWFSGFNQKYWNDKGALFAALDNKLTYLNILQYSIRKYKLTEGKMSFLEVLKYMVNGAKNYKNSK